MLTNISFARKFISMVITGIVITAILGTTLYLLMVVPAFAQGSGVIIVIDEPGEGISQALKQHYLTDLGMNDSSAQEKMLEELGNQVFYENGVLQDLVHIGDTITLDENGNVVNFERTSNLAGGRLPDTLGLISASQIRFDNKIITLPRGLSAEVSPNRIDQHSNIIFTDSIGNRYRLVGYGVDQNVLIDSESTNLGTWLAANFDFDEGTLTGIGGPEGEVDITVSEEMLGSTEDKEGIVSEDEMEEEGQAALAFLGLSGTSWLIIIAIIIILILLVWYFRTDEGEKKGEIDFTKP